MAPVPVAAWQAPDPRQSPAPREFSVLAPVSLVIALFFPLGSIPAVIVSQVAFRRIRTRRQDGRGFAVAGFVLGLLGCLAMAGLVLVVFISSGIVEKPDGSCATEARTIAVATEAAYAKTGTWPTTVDQLVAEGMLRRRSQLWDLYDIDGGDATGPPVIVSRTEECEDVAVPHIG